LDVVIGDEAKRSGLGKNGSFVVDGTIFEAERQARGYAAVMNYFDQISACNDLPGLSGEGKETMQRALGMADTHSF